MKTEEFIYSARCMDRDVNITLKAGKITMINQPNIVSFGRIYCDYMEYYHKRSENCEIIKKCKKKKKNILLKV